jgi:hypothetical protein
LDFGGALFEFGGGEQVAFGEQGHGLDLAVEDDGKIALQLGEIESFVERMDDKCGVDVGGDQLSAYLPTDGFTLQGVLSL